MSCWEHTEEQAEELLSHSLKLQNESKNVDSLNILNHLLEHHVDDLEEWRIHEYLGFCFFNLDQHESAISHLKKAWEYRNSNVNSLNLLSILNHLASSYYIRRENQESMKYFNLAEQYFDSCSREEYAVVRFQFRLSKGRCYAALGNNNKSLSELLNAETELKDVESDDAQLVRLNVLNYEIGSVYVYMYRMVSARKRLEKVKLDLLGVNIHSAYRSLKLRYHYFKKEYKSVLENFIIFEKEEIPIGAKAEAYFFVGAAHQKMGEKEKTKNYYTLALENDFLPEWQEKRATNFLNNLEASPFNKFVYYLKQMSLR